MLFSTFVSPTKSYLQLFHSNTAQIVYESIRDNLESPVPLGRERLQLLVTILSDHQELQTSTKGEKGMA
ncbi:hypothetical protein JTE90_011568 [Oedothorax gibbosus]|uniref:Uncharacterized protein n=1 Tax=Oedothorax gibbosus TaxID=931172 RepID=A0AAV6UKN9_9ARAC|nr:hypothetical protein JTE90_011568 [Oedothorax gibbosus]